MFKINVQRYEQPNKQYGLTISIIKYLFTIIISWLPNLTRRIHNHIMHILSPIQLNILGNKNPRSLWAFVFVFVCLVLLAKEGLPTNSQPTLSKKFRPKPLINLSRVLYHMGLHRHCNSHPHKGGIFLNVRFICVFLKV